MPSSVLIIDDEEAIAWALRRACEREGYRAVVAASAEAGLAHARNHPPEAVFLDIRLPGMDGLTALSRFAEVAPDAAVVVMTAHGNLDTAVRAVAGGAFDYLAKPFDLDAALSAVQRALSRHQKVAETTSPPLSSGTADEIVGASPAMQTVFKRIALVAPTDACVLVTGESGTGKELVARAVHAHSPRRKRPFLPVHVAALNPNLVESELFGHARGAFTGADRHRPGLLTLADGGTIFLDELADIPLPVQAKLLRVLERQELIPVGGTEAQKVNVRIVSATHADLAARVADGSFRHDLFYRLNVYPIHVPPLRERIEDIPLLATHFLQSVSHGGSLPADTIVYLESRSWPGNVRELRNAIEHASIIARGGPLRPDQFPAPMFTPGRSDSVVDRLGEAVRDWVRIQGTNGDLYQRLLEVVEAALLAEVLQDLHGNRLAAARRLGLARATVRKLIRKYNLLPDDDEHEPVPNGSE